MNNIIILQDETNMGELEAHSSLVHLCKQKNINYNHVFNLKFPFAYGGFIFHKLQINRYTVNRDFFSKKYVPYGYTRPGDNGQAKDESG
ncbi:hypothetical protein AMJ86_00670 [bacterium SM23_57]|nr:MAG: hypothetical protein AMJ86_00670 [bacterium SM23_57]